ncbi:MAG: lamin tail domain-containing protein [Thermoanaerobaculia bacterium]
MKLGRSLLVSLVVPLLAAVPASAADLRVYFPDIEQGSSILVVSPSGKALLVDAGTGIRTTEDLVENFINDLIDAGIVSSVDYTVASHYDEDHIGRMENVFQLVPLAPGFIAYDRGEDGGTPSTFAYGDYEFGAEQNSRTTITPNTTIDLGSGVTVRCYVVNAELPDATSVDLTGTSQQENARSVGLVVSYGDFDLWLGGDLTGNAAKNVAEVEQAAAPFVGDVDVYTFNHHGSETSSVADFLSTLKAELGISQVSASNSFGHPRAVVVQDFLNTLDTAGNTPIFIQQNPGDPDDTRSDDSLADAIADCDDITGAFGLPATVTLVSDGTSYRIHACGVLPSAFSADAGVGTIGDYPPAIMRVLRTPQVPLATESVTVEADVEDLEGASTVEIDYELDGVAQTPISMTLSSGVTYTGAIPAQPDGTRVKFRVTATDGAAQTELSAAQGYYSGTTDIADLRNNDADGVLLHKEYGVRVRGNMTVEPGIFHTFVTQAYVQDSTGGVQIFDTGIDGTIQRGDEVEWVGVLEQFGGQTEVSVAGSFGNTGHTRIGSGTAPAPQVVTVAQAGEAVEGTLIRINDVTVISGTIPGSGSGTLTISDDGGTSTLDLRIDGDTDIPGSNTPTQAFDVLGIASQFDTWAPFLSSYQITPREKTDIVSDEVNHPVVLISEIHADPASGIAGDANGDGVRDATDDEFVEIVNTGFTPFDISGWTIADGIRVRHTFPANTVIPPREAAVVFGGGTPTGDFGNAMANGLVFTADDGALGLNNTGDTVTLADDLGATVQAVTYGSEANSNESIVRDPDLSNAPFVQHTVATGSGGSLYSPGTKIDGQTFTIQSGALLLTEVLYDAVSTDDEHEWVELYNNTSSSIDLSDLCIGSGGSDYTTSLVSLSGSVAAGATFVVGGTLSDANNGNPTFDQAVDFSPDFQNSDSTTADGVALFNVSCSQVTPSTVPIDAVVYGPANTNSLIDETGVANAPDVADASSGQSIERIDVAGTWQIQPLPNPNVAFPPPPPAGLILSEVFINPDGADDGFEWVEIYNSGSVAIDLSQFSLGNGGTSYTYSTVQLSGTLQPGATWVVGGPSTDASNGNPAYDQVLNFSPDFQNSGSTSAGDGVALFNVPEAAITGSTVPIDAIIYGADNSNGLIDETGSANAPETAAPASGQAIERLDLAGTWQLAASPGPNAFSPGGGDPPPAAPANLAATGGNGSVSLDWDDNTEGDLDGYNVYRSTTQGGPYSQINGSLVATSDYVDNGVTNGTTYYYVVTAVDTAAQESGDSNEASATPDSATTLHVSSIVLSTVNVGQGNKQGRAVVTIVDNLGNPVSTATVTGTFSGDYSETQADATDGSGVATIDTVGTKKGGISFSFCVDSVTHGSFTYDSGANVETCDSF